MKIAAHIPFFFVESRVKYLRQVIHGLNEIHADVEIFIYTNQKFKLFQEQKNITFKFYPYRKSGKLGYNNGFWHALGLSQFVHPFYLTWENRKEIKKNIELFDVQIYLEDDLYFNADSFQYWISNKNICLENNYNLGFLRVESDLLGKIFLTDIPYAPKTIVKIDNMYFLKNDVNTYCGFWIYDQAELKEFIKTPEWKFNFVGFPIREKSAIGWHSLKMNRYKGTIIPVSMDRFHEYLLPSSCLIHHIPNSYIHHPMFCKIELSRDLNGNYKLVEPNALPVAPQC